jgi:dihydrofolate synthase/folylpolyglutamate synthase
MNYEAAVRYLLSLGRELAAPTHAAAAKFDLENIRILAERLGRPEQAYPSAHIAGTNGKGSTAAFLEAILRRAGMRTGLYTSPHLERINERIRIDGEEISDEKFAESFSRIHSAVEELLAEVKLRAHPTYFECVTAMAFECFASEGVEFGVFEAGLGGRLDATNILMPAVTILTRIDFDHENFLGHALQEIAAEKAGILKHGVPVITAPQPAEAMEVIRRRAAELGCRVEETTEMFHVETESLENGCVRARLKETATGAAFALAPRLPGRFQLQNALNAIAAARELQRSGAPIPDSSIAAGVAATEWPGRLERLQTRPDVYLDGAHNPGAARELAAFWEESLPGRRIRLVYGALRDKAVDEIAGALFPRSVEVIFTEPRTSRAISAGLLAEMTGHYAACFRVIRDAEEAVEQALAAAAPGDVVFVTGSLYLVGQIRHFWKNRVRVPARA